MGTEYRIDADTTLKVKTELPSGDVSTHVEHRLANPRVLLGVATAFNLKSQEAGGRQGRPQLDCGRVLRRRVGEKRGSSVVVRGRRECAPWWISTYLLSGCVGCASVCQCVSLCWLAWIYLRVYLV